MKINESSMKTHETNFPVMSDSVLNNDHFKVPQLDGNITITSMSDSDKDTRSHADSSESPKVTYSRKR